MNFSNFNFLFSNNKYKFSRFFVFLLYSTIFFCQCEIFHFPQQYEAKPDNSKTKTFFVIYDTNGAGSGSAPADSVKYKTGQTVTVLGNPGSLIKPGYALSGWNTTEDGSGITYARGQSFSMGSGNVILYAIWTLNPTYTVTYDSNKADSGSFPIDPVKYVSGQIVTVLDNTGNLKKSDFLFSGWNTAADGSGITYSQGQIFNIGSEDVILYAVWTQNPTYFLIYDSNGADTGSVPVDFTNYVSGQSVTILGNIGYLNKSGYSFSGWNAAADGSGTTYTQGQTIRMESANKILYAEWTLIPTYTITYNGNYADGGSVPIDSVKYETDQIVTVLANSGNLTKSFYSFSGWNTAADGSGKIFVRGQTFSMGLANIVLYAVWVDNRTYKVTYDYNGAENGSVPVDPNKYKARETVTIFANTGNLTKSGHSFSGWSTAADTGGINYKQGQTFIMGSADVTLYTRWKNNTFISIWRTTNEGQSNDNQISLPLVDSGSYNFIVDWGDGNSNTITRWDDADKLHTYDTAGTYTININGIINGWSFNNTLNSSVTDAKKLIEISNWGSLVWGITRGQFYNCEYLVITASDTPDLSKTISLRCAFFSCYSLVTIPSINDWDTSAITDMGYLFYFARSFNQDLSSWDTSGVTDMCYMFGGAVDFNHNIGSWDTSRVTDMSNMFYNALDFNYDIGNWDTANVTTMYGMFSGAESFNQDISSWDTSRVTSMYGMFSNAKTFNQAIGSWDTSHVTNMRSMFRLTDVFNQDIRGWDTSRVANMSYMFGRAGAFNQPIGDWDTSHVTDMSGMFSYTRTFNQDISNWNTSLVTDMSFMFYFANVFNQDISGWKTSSVTNMRYMFNNAITFDRDIGTWDITNVTNMSYMFSNVTLSIDNYNAILTGWERQSVQYNIIFNGGNSRYSSAAAAARQNLINDHSWTITDGGPLE